MTLKEAYSYTVIRKSAGAGLLLIIVAALTLEATSLIQFYFSQKGLREEATLRAESELESSHNEIMNVINQAESAVRNHVWITRWCLNFPDSLQTVTRLVVQNNPVVVGSTVALVPGYSKKYPLFAPYSYQEAGSDELISKSLATESYDYPDQEWFKKALDSENGYWSEPYLDEGGGDIIMTTFSLPIRDEKGVVAAVLTADISLDWLTQLVGNVKVYPNAFSMVISRQGQIMVCPAETLIMRKTVNEVASSFEDTTSINALNRAMLAGEEGSMSIREKGVTSQVFFSPVERTGWSMSIVIPEHEIFGGIRRIGMVVKILQILGILMLIVILTYTSKSQLKYQQLNQQKERMHGELKIASDIQMSMIPKVFPPFPEREDIDMAADLVPAKEVGGDLYDYFIRDEKLYFCIGDVSGKGIPASLVMSMTCSLFHSLATRENSPAQIVGAMNDSLMDMNENDMFVTFFCGALDMQTGLLSYCNAGHNAPMILRDDIQMLPVDANLPLGVLRDFSFSEQQTRLIYDDALFLYTDGLTEAENIHHELFGEERAVNVLHTRRSAYEHLKHLQAAVAEFVDQAPQSDDLTMLFIHFLGKTGEHTEKRQLELHNDIQQIDKLTEFIDAIATDKGLDPSLTMSLNLAMEEAVSNVILYAYPEGTDGIVDVDAILHDDRLVFIISDSGKAFDPTQKEAADITLGVEERRIGGLGILMVKNIMDKVAYRRDKNKNILLLTKYI